MDPEAEVTTPAPVAAAAEEPPQLSFTPTETKAEAKYTEEDLIAARRQEKSKLYTEIDSLKTQMSQILETQHQEQERKAAEQRAAEEAARKQDEEDMDVRSLFEKRTQELQEQLEAERQERERAVAMWEKERQFAEVQAYRNARIEEERDAIIPELLDLVAGDTPEQVDESIAGLRERSSRILSSAQQAAQTVRRDLSGARVTAPSAGPLDNYSDQRTFTSEQLREMSMADYKKYREGLVGNDSGQGQDLFG